MFEVGGFYNLQRFLNIQASVIFFADMSLKVALKAIQFTY